jgi:hypothetical protein
MSGLRLFAVLAWLLVFGGGAVADEHEGPVFELRTYTTLEGRLPALEARFRDHTRGLFEKHGMRNIGYWIPSDKPNTLIYIIAHPSQEAVASGWRAFATDPEWQKVAKESTKDGPILVEGGIQSQFMKATDYSPIQ